MDRFAARRVLPPQLPVLSVIAVALLSGWAAAQQRNRERSVGKISRPPLIEAAERGDLAGVTARLAKGDPVDLRDQFRTTALVAAAWGGHFEIVKLLVERGADVNAAPQGGSTSLMGAAVHDRVEIATLLLKTGARVDPSDEQGKTALLLAAQSNSAKLIALLVKHGAKVDAQAGDGSTPLVEAAGCGQREAVRALLEAGANINLRDKSGQTPLVAAVDNRRADVVTDLLARGADVTLTGWSGDTAMERATKRGDAEIIALLTKPTTKKADRQEPGKAAKNGKKRKRTAPDLVSSNVDGDDRKIDPSLTELVLTFDRPMNTRRYHLATVNAKKYGVFPELVGDDPISFRDERTLVLRVKLEPNKKYGFGMNEENRLEFRSAEGVPLEPLIFFFGTGEAAGEKTRS
jgi:ankyrin repeat protein